MMLVAGQYAVVEYAKAPVAVAPPRFLDSVAVTHRRASVEPASLPTPSDVLWVDQVRHDGLSALLDWGLKSAEQLDVANTVLNELVTYVLRYGTGPSIDVHLALFSDSVRVAVRGGPLSGIQPCRTDALAGLDGSIGRLPLTCALTKNLCMWDDWLTCSLEVSTAECA